jgi:CheY-like chemotaxis protein
VIRDDGPQHILVIDDALDLVAIYRELLEDEGYRVSVELSPDLMPDSILALAPDLILVDLLFGHEPRGYELIESLKGHPATRDIPVLVCSADAHLLQDLSDQLLAWDCGVMLKPFSLDALLEAIADCLPSSLKIVSRSLPLNNLLVEVAEP